MLFYIIVVLSLLKPHHFLQFIEAINGEYVVDYHLQKDLQFIFL